MAAMAGALQGSPLTAAASTLHRRRKATPFPRRQATLGVLLLAWLLGACGSPRRDPSLALSLKAQRLCRERMAELPPGSSPRQARLSYARCLRSLDLEPPATAAAPSGETATSAPAAGEPGVSAEERYLHCRMHSEAIAAAAATYNRARWTLLNSTDEPGSPQRQQAQAALDRALEELGRAIPERLRAGQDLVPDALRQFQSCERSNFE